MNRYSLCVPGGRPDPESRDFVRALQVGFCCNFAMKFARLSGAKLGDLIRLIEGAAQSEQLKIYFNGYGDCVGYVIWAFLSPPVEAEYLAGNLRPLELWEYSEGVNAWVLDMAVRPGSLRHVLEDLRDVVFRDRESLTYARTKSGRPVFKRIHREDCSTFLSERTREATP
jgi:hemolysin-activating ACP:hemolysin acyltransferase